MKFRKITIGFDAPDPESAEDLICDIFFSQNLKGVVCHVPINEPDQGFGCEDLPVPEENSVTGYLPDIDSSDMVFNKIQAMAGALSDLGIRTRITQSLVDEEDWANAWKAYFDVTRISDRIIIKPEWKPYEEKKGEAVIHLDPGMAFGTGTHPTTAMCLRQVERFMTPGADFLDVGTGSGILMIAAAKLGAGLLTGIDTDETAVRVCRENLKKNHVSEGRVTLSCTTLDQLDPGPGKKTFDLIAANILAQVLVDLMPQLKQHMHERSVLILSGIITERLPDIMAALSENRLEPVSQDQTDEWVALGVRVQAAGL